MSLWRSIEFQKKLIIQGVSQSVSSTPTGERMFVPPVHMTVSKCSQGKYTTVLAALHRHTRYSVQLLRMSVKVSNARAYSFELTVWYCPLNYFGMFSYVSKRIHDLTQLRQTSDLRNRLWIQPCVMRRLDTPATSPGTQLKQQILKTFICSYLTNFVPQTKRRLAYGLEPQCPLEWIKYAKQRVYSSSTRWPLSAASVHSFCSANGHNVTHAACAKINRYSAWHSTGQRSTDAVSSSTSKIFSSTE